MEGVGAKEIELLEWEMIFGRLALMWRAEASRSELVGGGTNS
jgi:hypothetical protein